ncbi:MAG: radical SAM protein [Candidatus Lokiarchaeota archaeon]|nr:radical SAM protein [Candidatus Lokiarchaeota archaeon]
MNILYVNAANAGSLGLDSFLCAPPLALMYLTPTVPQHKKFLIDLKARPDTPDDFIRRMVQKADLVAITSYTPSIKSAMKVGSIAKEHGKPVIIGGYHASLVPEVAKEPMFDVAVQNEGELTFPEVVGILERDGKWTPQNLKGVQGISYKNNGNVVVSEPRPLVKDLDTLPMPDRTLIGDTRYEYFGVTMDALESSRGCVGQCDFCCVKEHTPTWRKKSPERVIQELEALSRKTRWIGYQDSEFSINMDRVRQICDLTIEHGLDKQWYSAQVRADDLLRDKKAFDRMVDAGFKMLFIGIESAHQASLDRIGKRETVGTIKEAVKMCHDNGVAVLGAIIIGNIGETYEDVLKTIKYANELEIDIAQFTALTPLPKTKLWDEMEKNGWIEEKDWTKFDFTQVVARTDVLTRKQIAELVHKAYHDFYIGSGFGDYFWNKAPRYFANKKNWWFFKMLPEYLKNIPAIMKLVEDFSHIR